MNSGQRLGDCILGRWTPEFGDPNLMGWVTVAFYAVAALLCVRAFWRWPDRVVRIFGLGLAVLLVILMINKQLDLQSALRAVGRCVSQSQGWYDDRQDVKLWFLLGLVSASAVFGLTVAWVLRHHLSVIWSSLLGLACLLSFVAVRAAGLRQAVGVGGGDAGFYWSLELGGIALIALNAWWLMMRHRSGPPGLTGNQG